MIKIFHKLIFLFLLVAEEKKIYLREKSNQLYSVAAYFFAKISCQIPILFITTNCLFFLIYILTNLNETFTYKFYLFSKIIYIFI